MAGFFPFRQQIYYTNSKGSHQASRSPPRWRQSDLELRATLDEDFTGFESSLEAEISVSNLPLYNRFVGKKKKKTAILE